MSPWGDQPTHNIRLTVSGKSFQRGGWGKPDTLTVSGFDRSGVYHEYTAYGKNAASLDRYIITENEYDLGIGDNDYGQITIKTCRKR